MTAEETTRPTDFIREAVAEDLKNGRYNYVRTRFPPEPNGYLHIGHTKAMAIDFGVAREFGGQCNLRFDDTNPVKEDVEYVDAIKEDIRWLGFDWGGGELYASDYFDKLYELAVVLVTKGLAYVDDQSAEDVNQTRGTLTEAGKDSPFRNRSVEENLDLLERMKRGEFPDGARVLRAKIDMASPNTSLRDPVMYRIIHQDHHRTGDKWKIYPLYDWAHGQNDSMEGVTHSLCSLEYVNHRPLYEWFLEKLEVFKPRQIEFARLNVTYTVLSKRKLLRLVKEGHVSGWDDPRMPTLRGMRRRGYTAEAILDFIERTGVSKVGVVNSGVMVDLALLEACVREDLNKRSQRRMVVLKPLKVVIDNYPDKQVEEMDAVNNPEDAHAGTRKLPFSKVLYIEQEDFQEVPAPKYFRLYPGNEVRLRYAYLVKCTHVVKDAAGTVTEVHCSYDPATRGGDAPDGRKVKSTIHWVSATHAQKAEIRMYDRLFTKEDPEEGEDDFLACLAPGSLTTLSGLVEPALAATRAGDRFQFERQGYFCTDPDSTVSLPIFNLT
ncbi:MAG TPA: glutamine--tRNA ligase/YqeY domain fusion protein, partial [Anaerolineales bacterium]